MNRRALILDFDGVVVPTEQLHFESWNAAFEELLGLRRTGGYKQLVGLTLAEIYALWSPAQTLSGEMKQKLLARKTELFFSLGTGRLAPMPGLTELLHRVRALDWYVMIASRARRRRLLRTLELIELSFVFDLVIGCEDAVEPTTDRKEHTRAAVPFGIDPARCLVVEDSPSGVRAACACGIGCVIGLTTSFDQAALLAAGAQAAVDHLDQIRLDKMPKEKTH